MLRKEYIKKTIKKIQKNTIKKELSPLIFYIFICYFNICYFILPVLLLCFFFNAITSFIQLIFFLYILYQKIISIKLVQ